MVPMPELPEVETIRRTLEPSLAGERIGRVTLRRRDVLRQPRRGDPSPLLLQGAVISAVSRHGKQLVLEARDGRALRIHLGMSGRLWLERGAASELRTRLAPHLHAEWRLASGATLLFADPRRFGGLWAFPSVEAVRCTQAQELGPDALLTPPEELARHLQAAASRSRRPIKALLLDQSLVAGLGNIYVDEILFRVGMHPGTPARRAAASTTALAAEAALVMRQAVQHGGSTVRDYVDAAGNFGRFQERHAVYGRGGKPCPRCGTAIRTATVAGRTTAGCPGCQIRRR